MKASFLLPTKNTERPNEEFVHKVIESINANCSYEKEILVFSPEPVEGENVTWFKEEEISGGSIYPLNFLCTKSKGEYVFVANDEYMFSNMSPDKAIRILDSSYYEDKKFKILGMGSPIPSFPNAHYTHGYTSIPTFGFDKHTYRICGYPVLHRDTIDKQLGGYIYHPKFIHHYGDNYMPLYAGFMGEPINDCPSSDLRLVGTKNITYDDKTAHDAEIYKQLFHDLVEERNLNYV
jgi:hypothetical protein